MQAVNAYRALVPSAVWVLGLKTPRDPKDELVRSLESLVEPFMEAYFAMEAQARVAAISAQLAKLLLPARNADPNRAINAVSATMWKDVSAAIALVDMLDRAHAIQPVELVLDDDSSGLARTAVAWAHARGLPSITLPARVPTRRPRKPSAEKTIVYGKRARQAYAAIEADVSDLIDVAEPVAPPPAVALAERSANRIAAKTALRDALGWQVTDIVVVFESVTSERDSALEPVGESAASLAAMFRAFVAARAEVPNLRMVVVAQPTPVSSALVARVAGSVGLGGGDYAYAQADYNVWVAAADIAVSVDSMWSADAAAAGAPAINLWEAINWYRTPEFAAEDGVIDVSPSLLGSTLVALAGNVELRGQIASIAGGRLALESRNGARVAAAIGAEFIRRRRVAIAFAGVSQRKPDIVIYAPPYSYASGGIRALYRLCHLINLAGGDASMYPGLALHPEWNTPRRESPITPQTIVVYPEIYNVPVPANHHVVRWVLNIPGLLAGPTTYGPDEMVFYFTEGFRSGAQAATAEILTDERELPVAIIEPELFFNDRSRPRRYDCVFIHKGRAIYDRVQPRETRDAYVIQTGQAPWPASRAETAALLRGSRRLYSFDERTAVYDEALICGARAFKVQADGELYELVADTSNYVAQYYDLSHVRRFLRLVVERWG